MTLDTIFIYEYLLSIRHSLILIQFLKTPPENTNKSRWTGWLHSISHNHHLSV